ncbi:MAG: ADP-ribosylation factor-like protein [Candidatus Ranarchaeia archaeon]
MCQHLFIAMTHRKHVPNLQKILLLGPAKSGKTTIAETLCQGGYNRKYIPTIGVTFHSLQINTTKIMLWDCGGKPHFRTLWPLFLSGANGIIFVIDGADSFSIAEGLLWLMQSFPTNIPRIVLINKQDQPHAVRPEEIKDLFDLHGVKIEGCVAFERDKLLKIVNSFLKSTMTSTENIADSNYNKEGTALAI